MKASHQHQQSTTISAHPNHPWLTTICVLCVVVIITAAAVFWIRRCNTKNMSRHEYHAVTTSSSVQYKDEMRLAELEFANFERDEELQKIQKHLNADNRYRLLVNLGTMGWRKQKQWFLIRDTTLGAERLLTLLEIPSNSELSPNVKTRLKVLELLRSLHHPYILPILDVEFWQISQDLVAGMVIQPLIRHGSLRDLIYVGESPQQLSGSFVDVSNRTRYVDQRSSRGLPFKQMQSLGRQILEALSFLQIRQFPKFYHLHAGNVIVQNGVARLAALENTIFCLAPKEPVLTHISAFGYLLFEISELNGVAPIVIHRDLPALVADVIDMIFDPSPNNTQPSVDALIRHELFRAVELRELWRCGSDTTPMLSDECNDFLQKISENQRNTQSASASHLEESDNVDPEPTLDVRHRSLTRTSSALDSQLVDEIDETLTLIVDGNTARMHR